MFIRDPGAEQLIANIRGPDYTESPPGNAYGGVDIPGPSPNHRRMTDITRPELDAKLEAIEARMDGRIAAIQSSIDGFIGRMEERSLRTDDRFARIESSQQETQESLKSLKSTIIVTAVSTVVAIVLGVAAFNATVLSNMVASFDSGRDVAKEQAEAKRQADENAATLKQMQQRLEAIRPETPVGPPAK